MSVCPLLTIFGFLHGRAAAVSSGDILFLLCLSLHLIIGRSWSVSSLLEGDAILKDSLKIVIHNTSTYKVPPPHWEGLRVGF